MFYLELVSPLQFENKAIRIYTRSNSFGQIVLIPRVREKKFANFVRPVLVGWVDCIARLRQ